MKRERVFTALWALFFGFCLSFSATAALISAFSMEVSVAQLAWVCLGASAVGAVCYSLPLGLVPIGGFALALGYYWRSGELELSVESLLYRLSRQYHQGYQWPIIRWNGRVAEDLESTLPLLLFLLAVAIALLLCRSICRKKSLFSGIFLNMLCLAPCFVVNDTVPGSLYLFLQLMCFTVLLLTVGVRRRSGADANRLTAIALPVTALALLVLFACAPRQGYSPENAKKLGDWFMNSKAVQTLLGKTEQDDQTSDASVVDLTQVGYQVPGKTRLLTVKADFSDTLYLRGRALDYYDGVSWSQSTKSVSELPWPTDLESAGIVEISTKFAHNMLYVPYYAASASMRETAFGVTNGMKLTEYSFSVRKAPTHAALGQYQADSQGLETYLAQYIDLPESVKKWAQPLAAKLTEETASVYRKAELVASYVRASASYDTNTPRMGTREKDFARWFLQDSDTGYCVHFATATTVLLQAAGVPARYVTGYTVQAVAGEEIEVTGEQAHAWCEYWLPNFGWTVLESTPPDLRPAPTEQTQPQPTEQPYTYPTETLPQQPTEKPEATVALTGLWSGLQGVLVLVAGLFLLWLQYRVRWLLRKKRLQKGNTNAQALNHWQYDLQLARHLAEQPPEEMQALAEKAKFSRHTITQQELAGMAAYETQSVARLKKKNVFVRFYYRLVLALY